MEMAGSLSAFDVSAIREDLKYSQALSVNVSNFVSVKLSGLSNYEIWKAQMLCLIKSQALLHIIDAENHFPEDKGVHMIAQYDELVKGWIFSSMKETLLKDFIDLGTAREVWMKLELLNVPIRGLDTQADALEVAKFYTTLRFVEVSNYVTVKLSGESNYNIWKAQMMRLIQNSELLWTIDDRYPSPKSLGFKRMIRYHMLVTDWIFETINENLLENLRDLSGPRQVWSRLEYLFSRPISDSKGDSSEDINFFQASSLNVSNFLSVKLSDQSNYKIWKAQMLCLIKSQELLHIIKPECPFLECKDTHKIMQYNELVKGWIFGSMTEKVLKDLVDLGFAQDVWRKLEDLYSPPTFIEHSENRVDFTFGIECQMEVPEMENTHNIRLKKELYDAVVEGCWWKAKSILKVQTDAITLPITANGNTILHLAVERGHTYFLEKLLEFVEDIETKNQKGRTALHIAAMVGNTHAAQILVQKKKELLVILDHNQESPLDSAFSNTKLDMSTYLLKSAISSDLNFDARGYAERTIQTAIFTKQYDLAWELLNKFPSDYSTRKTALMAITVTFPTELGFMESFIYPSFDNVRKKTFRRASLLFHYNTMDKYAYGIFRVMKIGNAYSIWLRKFSMILFVPIATLYPVYLIIFVIFLLIRLTLSMLYFLLWKVLVVTVHPIKNIVKKKKDYQEAKNILSLICTQIGTSTDTYKEAILEAVRQGTYEVVDEILFASPTTINCKDKNGHNIIQLAIINRSEKVYNLIHHIIERTESYRTMKDSSQNNFVHLAGRLAPSFVLDRTTGAALQLQRELKWREEMEKLMLPLERIEENFHKETPAMVFTREHQDLMKQGEIWMKETAGSCSITAALIVTVVFAAAITVPGGSNQESGIPVFKNEMAFTIFAVFNAFSLYTAAAALLLFLSILTARFSERDFLVSLPRRLILGLLTLFVSTTAMIVAFGAILFLVFCDKRPWMLAPICVFTCLPISVIVTIKLPLLVDLIQSTYFPIFGQQSYLESCKINTKNTTFMR